MLFNQVLKKLRNLLLLVHEKIDMQTEVRLRIGRYFVKVWVHQIVRKVLFHSVIPIYQSIAFDL